MATSQQASIQLRADNVKSKCSIFDGLDLIGVKLLHGHGTQQIVCPFHDDTKPSARAYGDSNKLFCFTCHKVWDVISVVMTGKGINYLEAIELLEKRFNVPNPMEDLALAVKFTLQKKDKSTSLDSLSKYVDSRLIEEKHQLGLQKSTRYLTALDHSCHYYAQKRISAEEHRQTLQQILHRLMEPAAN
jgi:DNA primase